MKKAQARRRAEVGLALDREAIAPGGVQPLRPPEVGMRGPTDQYRTSCQAYDSSHIYPKGSHS